MNRIRLVVGGLGVALAAYGALLALTRQDSLQLVEVAVWLAGGVALHDGLIAGVAIGLGLLGHRALPRPWQAPATLGLVVWGSVSVMAIPVLGRFGARSDNTTLLDRPYLASWVVLTLLTALAVVVAGALRARRAHRTGA